MVVLGFVLGKAKVKVKEREFFMPIGMMVKPLMRSKGRAKARKAKERKARIKVKARMVKTLQEKDLKLILQKQALLIQPQPHLTLPNRH